MRITNTIVAALVALAIASPITAADAAQKRKKAPARPPCVSAEVMPALNVYTLKTELMTAALSCDERDRYNQFVVLREADLTKYGGMVQRGLGTKTNHFVTEVANRSGGQLDCDEAARHFDQALSSESPSLETIATTEWSQKRHGYQVCPEKKGK